MITVVNEPKVEYKTKSWLAVKNQYSIDEIICGIENNTIKICQFSILRTQMPFINSKKRLSALRGKMTNQSENEIDEQISNLRKEWERNI